MLIITSEPVPENPKGKERKKQNNILCMYFASSFSFYLLIHASSYGS
jgi:hypothetical protein